MTDEEIVEEFSNIKAILADVVKQLEAKGTENHIADISKMVGTGECETLDKPTVGWLIDQISAPTSPLIEFNKKRLRNLIIEDREQYADAARVDELRQIPFHWETCYDNAKGEHYKKIDERYVEKRVAELTNKESRHE